MSLNISQYNLNRYSKYLSNEAAVVKPFKQTGFTKKIANPVAGLPVIADQILSESVEINPNRVNQRTIYLLNNKLDWQNLYKWMISNPKQYVKFKHNYWYPSKYKKYGANIKKTYPKAKIQKKVFNTDWFVKPSIKVNPKFKWNKAQGFHH